MASASAAGSRGGTRKPVSPSAISSAFPPTRVATIGLPAAIDSMMVLDMPSFTDEMTETSQAASSRATSRRGPVKVTRSPSPSA